MTKKRILAAVLAVVLLGGIFTGMFLGRVFTSVKDDHYAHASAELCNSKAADYTRALMKELKSYYGKNILSGQYVDTFQNYSDPVFIDENGGTLLKSNELTAVKTVTGKLPMVIGLDYIKTEWINEESKKWGYANYTTEQAIEWHNLGGIVTICWHWVVADTEDMLEMTAEDCWSPKRTFYTKDLPSFKLSKVLQERGAMYDKLMADIDAVAEQLKILQENEVPVLWRPMHEASGGWFWWGASGSGAYKELWDIIYDKMTNEHKLNNLIWVWNGQDKDWYVGENKCDIIGDDVYALLNIKAAYAIDKSISARFKKNYLVSQEKMICLSENGHAPNVNAAFRKNTKWLFFCTWMRDFTCLSDGTEYGMTNEYSAKCLSAKELNTLYNDARVMTLDSPRIK